MASLLDAMRDSPPQSSEESVPSPSIAGKLPLLRLSIWFLASRCLLLLVAALSLRLIPKGPFSAGGKLVDWLYHWDAKWYADIARNGYYFDPHAQSSVTFFPLYPILMRLVSFATHDLRVAGYLLSNGFLFASTLLLWKLVTRDYGNRALADRAVLFLLICPMTIFYSGIYTESLFLFLSLGTAWFAGERRWLVAGVCGFLAALTRPPGVFLAVLIAVEYGSRFLGENREENSRPFNWGEGLRAFTGMALPGAGLALYALYLQIKFGDPLAVLHAHSNWHQHLTPFWDVIFAGLDYSVYDAIWFYTALVTGLVMTALVFKFRLRWSHLALVVALMLLYCSSNRLESMPRYLSVVFPFYIVTAEFCLRHPRLERVLMGISTVLAGYSIVLFVDGYWFT
jgi:Gpi18-like mannosyltransferase